MKKLLHGLMIATLGVVMSSCDMDYDFGNIKTDNIVVGNGGFVVPLGDIKISTSDLLNVDAIGMRTASSYSLRPYNETFKIEAGFDEGLIDKLTAYGQMRVVCKAVNPFPVALKLNAAFYDSSTSIATPVVVDGTILASPAQTELKTELLDKTSLEAISKSDRLTISIVPASTAPFTFDPAQIESLTISLSIVKTEGIKL